MPNTNSASNPFVALHLSAALNPTNQAWNQQYQQDGRNGPGAPVSSLVTMNPMYQAWSDLYRQNAGSFGRPAPGQGGDSRGLLGLSNYMAASPEVRANSRVNIPVVAVDSGRSPVGNTGGNMAAGNSAGIPFGGDPGRIRNMSAGLPTGEYDFIGGSGSQNIDDSFQLGQGEASRQFLGGPGLVYHRPSGPIDSQNFEGDGWGDPAAPTDGSGGHPAINAIGRNVSGLLGNAAGGPILGWLANRVYRAANNAGMDFNSTTPHDWGAFWRNLIHLTPPTTQH